MPRRIDFALLRARSSRASEHAPLVRILGQAGENQGLMNLAKILRTLSKIQRMPILHSYWSELLLGAFNNHIDSTIE